MTKNVAVDQTEVPAIFPPKISKRYLTKQSLQRTVKAELRDAGLLLQEARHPLILFLTILVGGALVLNFFYFDPDVDERFDFVQSLYATFALIFILINIFPAQSNGIYRSYALLSPSMDEVQLLRVSCVFE
jgi:hypothetical protein